MAPPPRRNSKSKLAAAAFLLIVALGFAMWHFLRDRPESVGSDLQKQADAVARQLRAASPPPPDPQEIPPASGKPGTPRKPN